MSDKAIIERLGRLATIAKTIIKEGTLIIVDCEYYVLVDVFWYPVINLGEFVEKQGIVALGEEAWKSFLSIFGFKALMSIIMGYAVKVNEFDINRYPEGCTHPFGGQVYHCPTKRWLPITWDMYVIYEEFPKQATNSVTSFKMFLSAYFLSKKSIDTLRLYLASLLLLDRSLHPTLILSGEGNDGKWFIQRYIKEVYPDSRIFTNFDEWYKRGSHWGGDKVVIVEVPDKGGHYEIDKMYHNVIKESIRACAVEGLPKLYSNGAPDWEGQTLFLLMRFLSYKGIVRTGEPLDRVFRDELYAEFVEWNKSTNSTLPMEKGVFNKRLTDLGYRTVAKDPL